MTDETTPKPTKPSPAPVVDAVSPDELMSDFRGHSLVKILIFTVIVHVFVLALFSPGYIKAQVFGESEEPAEEVAELSDEEKLEKAQKDGKAALREVADKYGITVKALKEQLDSEPAAAPDTTVDTPADPEPTDTEGTGSQIERDLETEADGPAVPDLSIEEEDDIFAPESP